MEISLLSSFSFVLHGEGTGKLELLGEAEL